MRAETFHTPGTPSLAVVGVASGVVEIETGDGEETHVTLEGQNDPGRDAVERATVVQSGDEVRVELPERAVILALRSAKVRIRVTCPHGTRLRGEVVAADLAARGRFGTTSLKSVSGDLKVAEVDGDLDLKTVSGDASVEAVTGSASLNTVSGDLRVGELGGSAKARTVSGDLDLGSVRNGEIAVQSVSGDVKVGIAAGAGVWMDLKSLSGNTRSDLSAADGPTGEEGSTLEVRAKSVSGDIRLVRA